MTTKEIKDHENQPLVAYEAFLGRTLKQLYIALELAPDCEQNVSEFVIAMEKQNMYSFLAKQEEPVARLASMTDRELSQYGLTSATIVLLNHALESLEPMKFPPQN